MTIDNLDEYFGSVIDIDGSRYRLVGLDGYDALLADPAPAAGELTRMRAGYVAEAMVHILPRAILDPRQPG